MVPRQTIFMYIVYAAQTGVLALISYHSENDADHFFGEAQHVDGL